MSQQAIRAGVLATLLTLAPEVEADQLVAGKSLRGQVDLDSMDWLNFIIGLHKRFDVDIPEADYATLTTLDAIVSYLAARLD